MPPSVVFMLGQVYFTGGTRVLLCRRGAESVPDDSSSRPCCVLRGLPTPELSSALLVSGPGISLRIVGALGPSVLACTVSQSIVASAANLGGRDSINGSCVRSRLFSVCEYRDCNCT